MSSSNLLFSLYKKSVLVVNICFALTVSCSQPKSNKIMIEVVGKDFKWEVRYAGIDGVFYTSDDKISLDAIYVPEHSQIDINLSSADYLYFLSLPDFDVRAMALTEMNANFFFRTMNKGIFSIKGDQMCGFTHESLSTKLYVVSQDEFSEYLLN